MSEYIEPSKVMLLRPMRKLAGLSMLRAARLIGSYESLIVECERRMRPTPLKIYTDCEGLYIRKLHSRGRLTAREYGRVMQLPPTERLSYAAVLVQQGLLPHELLNWKRYYLRLSCYDLADRVHFSPATVSCALKTGRGSSETWRLLTEVIEPLYDAQQRRFSDDGKH